MSLLLSACANEPAKASEAGIVDGLSGLYERVSPAVVRIVSHRASVQHWGSGGATHRSASYRRLVATGIVIAPHGCVVTTDRVAQSGDSIVVHFPDGREVGSRYVGRNRSIHIAVLQLQGPADYPALSSQSIGDVAIPKWVATVGYGPWGDEQTRGPSLTLAQGSAIVGTTIPCGDTLGTVWRLKAPVYPGNGGGALVSLDGEWLGLITGVVPSESRHQSARTAHRDEGVIVPANLVACAAMEIEEGRPPSGFLGVQTYRRPITPSDSLWRGIGVIVSETLPGGPAERHGIQPGDIILRFGDQAVEEVLQLTRMVMRVPPGTSVPIELLRDGVPRIVHVSLGDLEVGRDKLERRWEVEAEARALQREILRTDKRLSALRRRLGRLQLETSQQRQHPPTRSSSTSD